MSGEVEEEIIFGCYYGGKFERVGGKLLYISGGYQYVNARPSELFNQLMNQLPISLYAQRVWYKVPFDEVDDRRLLTSGSENFDKLCRSAIWTKAIDIYVEPNTETEESEREEPVREETVREETETEEPQRNVDDEDEFPEEARVERNVRDFVDEEIDEYATPVCSDDDDEVGRLQYFTYKKGSGELKLQQAFDSLEAFKKAMMDYVLKYGWNVQYCRWDSDKSELKCASVAEEGEEACKWKVYCSYEAPLQKWMIKTYVKDHSCSKT